MHAFKSEVISTEFWRIFVVAIAMLLLCLLFTAYCLVLWIICYNINRQNTKYLYEMVNHFEPPIFIIFLKVVGLC